MHNDAIIMTSVERLDSSFTSGTSAPVLVVSLHTVIYSKTYSENHMQTIHTVAAVITNENGDVLLVRKRATTTFIQPGGKIEANEEPLLALVRELDEELRVQLEVSSAFRLGEFQDVAVNEPGRMVRAQAYLCVVHGTPTPQAEIEELIWVNPRGPYHVPVAPLSANHILRAFAAYTDNAIVGSD
jgi:8-oxo-dGTP diphosphatase